MAPEDQSEIRIARKTGSTFGTPDWQKIVLAGRHIRGPTEKWQQAVLQLAGMRRQRIRRVTSRLHTFMSHQMATGALIDNLPGAQ
jgi:hypothetical protein